jgi:hypothetical protein
MPARAEHINQTNPILVWSTSNRMGFGTAFVSPFLIPFLVSTRIVYKDRELMCVQVFYIKSTQLGVKLEESTRRSLSAGA